MNKKYNVELECKNYSIIRLLTARIEQCQVSLFKASFNGTSFLLRNDINNSSQKSQM